MRWSGRGGADLQGGYREGRDLWFDTKVLADNVRCIAEVTRQSNTKQCLQDHEVANETIGHCYKIRRTMSLHRFSCFPWECPL